MVMAGLLQEDCTHESIGQTAVFVLSIYRRSNRGFAQLWDL